MFHIVNGIRIPLLLLIVFWHPLAFTTNIPLIENKCTFLQFTNETNETNNITVLWNYDCVVNSTDDSDFIRFSGCGTSTVREFLTTTAVTLLTPTTAVTLLTTSSTTGVNNVGVIAGCVAGGVVVLIIIILINVLVCRVKRRRQKTLEKSVRQDGGYTEVDLTLSSAYTVIDLNLDSKKSPSVLNGSEKGYQKIFVVSGDNNRDEDKDVKKCVENLDTKQNVESNALGAHRYSYARVVKSMSQDGGQFIPDVTQTEGQVGPPDVTQTGQVRSDVSEYSRLGEHPRVLQNLYNMVSVSGQSLDTGSGQHHSTLHTIHSTQHTAHSTQHTAATDRPIEITMLRPRVPDNSISNGYSQVDITRNNANHNNSFT